MSAASTSALILVSIFAQVPSQRSYACVVCMCLRSIWLIGTFECGMHNCCIVIVIVGFTVVIAVCLLLLSLPLLLMPLIVNCWVLLKIQMFLHPPQPPLYLQHLWLIHLRRMAIVADLPLRGLRRQKSLNPGSSRQSWSHCPYYTASKLRFSQLGRYGSTGLFNTIPLTPERQWSYHTSHKTLQVDLYVNNTFICTTSIIETWAFYRDAFGCFFYDKTPKIKTVITAAESVKILAKAAMIVNHLRKKVVSNTRRLFDACFHFINQYRIREVLIFFNGDNALCLFSTLFSLAPRLTTI